MSNGKKLLISMGIAALIIAAAIFLSNCLINYADKQTDNSTVSETAAPISEKSLYCIDEDTPVYIRSAETEKLDIPGIIIIPANGLRAGVPARITIRDKENVPHDITLIPCFFYEAYDYFIVTGDSEQSKINITPSYGGMYQKGLSIQDNLYKCKITLNLTPADFKACYETD